MSQNILIELQVPKDLRKFRLPKALNRRLQEILDRQSDKGKLTAAERREAEGLVTVGDMLTLLRLRAQRAAKRRAKT